MSLLYIISQQSALSEIYRIPSDRQFSSDFEFKVKEGKSNGRRVISNSFKKYKVYILAEKWRYYVLAGSKSFLDLLIDIPVTCMRDDFRGNIYFMDTINWLANHDQFINIANLGIFRIMRCNSFKIDRGKLRRPVRNWR